MIKFFTILVLFLSLSSVTIAQQIVPALPKAPHAPAKPIPPEDIPQAESTEWLQFHTSFVCNVHQVMFNLTEGLGQKAQVGGRTQITSSRTGKSIAGSMLFSVNENESEWSILVVLENGITCMLATGSTYTEF